MNYIPHHRRPEALSWIVAILIPPFMVVYTYLDLWV